MFLQIVQCPRCFEITLIDNPNSPIYDWDFEGVTAEFSGILLALKKC